MFGSVVLEVILGLGFAFAAFSLACSALVELLESVRSQRGKHLAIFIERMLGSELKQRFYEHALIRSLSKAGRLPSYLPAQSFSRVVFDLLGLDAKAPPSKDDPVAGEIGQIVRILTQDAAGVEQSRQRLEQWFDSAMDRCAGAYRRRARWAALGVAFTLAALLNVDAIEIASVLYADSHLRLSTVAEAGTDTQIPIVRRVAEKTPSVMSIPIESGTLPLGWENSRLTARAQFAEGLWHHPAFWLGPVLSKVLGLLVTALGASLGAGLWFEVLKHGAMPRVRANRRQAAVQTHVNCQFEEARDSGHRS